MLALCLSRNAERVGVAPLRSGCRDIQRKPLRAGVEQSEVLGAITPIGGVCLLGGWLALAIKSR